MGWTSSISLWGVDLAGTTIQALAQVEGYCEQASPPQTFQAGNNSSQATPDHYVQIYGLNIATTNWPTTVTNRDCPVSYSYTNGATGTIYYNPGFNDKVITTGGLSITGATGWRTLTVPAAMSWTYTKDSATTGSFRAWGAFKSGTLPVIGDKTGTGGDPVTAIKPTDGTKIDMTQ